MPPHPVIFLSGTQFTVTGVEKIDKIQMTNRYGTLDITDLAGSGRIHPNYSGCVKKHRH